MIENCEKLAEQLYPERPINLPEGQAVVVPMPERRAFIAGAAWQAAQFATLRPELDEAKAALPNMLAIQLREAVRADEAEAQLAEARAERYKALAVLEPFARHAEAVSLSDALGHIERAHLMAARDLVAQLLRAEEPPREARWNPPDPQWPVRTADHFETADEMRKWARDARPGDGDG